MSNDEFQKQNSSKDCLLEYNHEKITKENIKP
jgi:hypothetical protein